MASPQGLYSLLMIWVTLCAYCGSANKSDMNPCVRLAPRAFISQSSHWTIAYADADEKVFPDDPIPFTPRNAPGVVPLCGARGEAVPFQIIVHAASSPVNSVRVSISGGSGYVLRVDYANVSQPTNTENKTGWFPDPLLDTADSSSSTITLSSSSATATSTNVAAGGLVAFWVTLVVANNTITTQLTDIALKITSDETQTTVPIQVRVWDFSIPASRTMLLDAAFGSGAKIGQNNSSLTSTLTQNASVANLYFDNFVRHNVNRQVWGVVWPAIEIRELSDDGSTVVLDTKGFDAQAARLIAQNVRQFRLPPPRSCSSFIAGCDHNCLSNETKWRFAVYAANGTVTTHSMPVFSSAVITNKLLPLNPDFEKLFRAVYSKIIQHLSENNWMEFMPYAAFIDEANYDDPYTYAVVNTVGRLFKSLDSRVKFSITRFPLNPAPEIISIVDAWTAHVEQILTPGVLEQMCVLRASNPATELYIYNNGVPIIDLPGSRLRTFPWQIWRTNFAVPQCRNFGLQGSLSWYAVTGFGTDPATPSTPASPNPWQCANQYPHCEPKAPGRKPACPYNAAGWGMLLWPPKDLDFNKPPVTSIRWELMAKGQADTEYFYRLDSLAQRAQKTCKNTPEIDQTTVPPCCQEGLDANNALAATGDAVWNFTLVDPGEDQPYTTNTTLLYDVLDTVALHIEAIQTACGY